MLVLTRRPGESIVIGNDVVVTVLEVRGEQIRVGVQAPRSVQVHREEVHREIQRANSAAVASAQAARQALASRRAPGTGGDSVKQAPQQPPRP